MREEVLLPAARSALEDLSPPDRARFDRIIRELCINPSVAERIRTFIDVLPVELFRYRDAEYVVAFDLPDDATLRVWMIGKASGA